jgi:hypothetical protein
MNDIWLVTSIPTDDDIENKGQDELAADLYDPPHPRVFSSLDKARAWVENSATGSIEWEGSDDWLIANLPGDDDTASSCYRIRKASFEA